MASKQKYTNFLQSMDQTKSNYQSALALLKTVKNKLQIAEEKLSKAESENYRLSLRAATNFSELTPRPNYDPLVELLTEFPKNFNEKSTVEKTSILTEEFKKTLEEAHNFQKRRSYARSNSRKISTKKGFFYYFFCIFQEKLTIFSR